MDTDKYLEELLKDLKEQQQKCLNRMKEYVVVVIFEMFLFFILLILIFK